MYGPFLAYDILKLINKWTYPGLPTPSRPQEMIMDLAGKSMVKSSFTGAFVHAPVPGSTAVNNDRHLYNAFQQWLDAPQIGPSMYEDEESSPEDNKEEEAAPAEAPAPPPKPKQLLSPSTANFLEWCRKFDVKRKAQLNTFDEHGRQQFAYTLRGRNLQGRGSNKKCAVAMQFPYELLDIYVGSYMAVFKPGLREKEVWPSTENVPENMAHLAAALQPANYGQPDQARAWKIRVHELMGEMASELTLRGLGENRVENFKHRILGCAMVLRQVVLGQEDASLWSAANPFRAPSRTWSPQQQQVLDAVKAGTSVTDANDLEVSSRVLQVTGGPGTGKTEVIIAAALAASDRGCRVLVGAPIGLLVSMYRRLCKHISHQTVGSNTFRFRDRP